MKTTFSRQFAMIAALLLLCLLITGVSFRFLMLGTIESQNQQTMIRDAEAVAELFRKELASGDFKVKQVFFAVPSTRWDEDFAKFEHVLANFPERNEESYAQVAARAAAARAAEQTQAATEDDEDEDDWRKYL